MPKQRRNIQDISQGTEDEELLRNVKSAASEYIPMEKDDGPEYVPEETLDGVPEGNFRREAPTPEEQLYEQARFHVGQIRTAKERSQAIEKAMAQVISGGVMLLSAKIFGVENCLLKEEAESIVEPTSRIVGRHAGKYFRAAIPIWKIKNQQDRADVEEVVATIGVYLFRLLLMAWQKFEWRKEMKKFAKNDPEGYSRYMMMNNDQRKAGIYATQRERQAQAVERRGRNEERVVSKQTAEAVRVARDQYSGVMEAIGHTDGGSPIRANLANDKVIINVPEGLDDGYEAVDPLDRILGG